MKKLNLYQKEKIMSFVYPAGFAIVLGVMWQTQLLHKILGTDTFTLPLPARIFAILFDNWETILKNVQATMTVAIIGLLLGSVIGYLLAVLATALPKWGMGGLNMASAFSAVPIIAIAPIMNNLTKDVSDDPNLRSMVAKILVVMLTCTVSMSTNAYRGFTELRPFSRDLMKSFAASPKTIFMKLRIPNCMPYLFTALRVSVPASIISALVSEYFAEYIIGVGRQIRENIVLAQYATAWAYIITACILGIFMYAILLIAETILLKGRS